MEMDLDEPVDVQQDQTTEKTSEIEDDNLPVEITDKPKDDKLQTKTIDKPNKKIEKTEKPNETHLVQITASNEEILRRITAFIERKQTDVDQNNRQEFCNVHPSVEDDEDSCARCRAIFVPRGDGKSHIKVSRVVNMYGPQTQVLASNRNNSPQKPHIKQEPVSTDGLEERLSNMEAHLSLKALSKVDVYKRLKNLEERILFLESLSPEYFSSGLPSSKRQKHSPRSTADYSDENKELSLLEIDARIASLRESLMKKSVPPSF